MLPECDGRCGENMDHCAKWGNKKMKCKPFTIDDFDENKLDQCEIDQVCRKCSIFGNDLIVITDEDIEALKNGKVLYKVGEYGLFLAYKKDESVYDENEKGIIFEQNNERLLGVDLDRIDISRELKLLGME